MSTGRELEDPHSESVPAPTKKRHRPSSMSDLVEEKAQQTLLKVPAKSPKKVTFSFDSSLPAPSKPKNSGCLHPDLVSIDPCSLDYDLIDFSNQQPARDASQTTKIDVQKFPPLTPLRSNHRVSINSQLNKSINHQAFSQSRLVLNPPFGTVPLAHSIPSQTTNHPRAPTTEIPDRYAPLRPVQMSRVIALDISINQLITLFKALTLDDTGEAPASHEEKPQNTL